MKDKYAFLLLLLASLIIGCSSNNKIVIYGNDSQIIEYISNNPHNLCHIVDSKELIIRGVDKSVSDCLSVNDYLELTNGDKIPISTSEEYFECSSNLITGGTITVFLNENGIVDSVVKNQ